LALESRKFDYEKGNYMAGRVEGKVALVTGAARGQGRAHALRLASEGADIIAVDNCKDVDTIPYGGATPDELNETAAGVEALGRRAVGHEVDVRDLAGLESAVKDAVGRLGRLDIVAANAGVSSFAATLDMTEDQWDTLVGINLTGVWKTCKAALPHLLDGGVGGSIILTGSGAGVKGFANIGHYAAAKSGLLGLMRTLANELGPHMIRVNCILPTTVSTPMIHNDATYRLFAPGIEHPTRDDFVAVMCGLHALPIPWVETSDIANALLFLASDDARYVTGVALPVDAGILVR
jgi:(+)-trans-carveol dehydrogenase/(-)-trans-carveol dehydrogenase